VPLFFRGIYGTLSIRNLWRLKKQEATLTVYQRFEERWLEGVKAGKPNLILAVISTFGFELLVSILMCLCHAGLQLTIPLLMPYIIRYLADPRYPSYQGYVYVAAIYVSYLCSSFLHHHNSFRVWRLGVRLRAALMTLIYRKSLRLAPGAVSNTGTIVNLMSTDAQIVLDSLLWFVQGIITPIQFAVILGLLSRQIGNFALIPLGLLFLGMPIMAFTSLNIGPMRLAIQQRTDERIKLTTELITAVRIVKYYAWERPFYNNIDSSREQELQSLKKFLTARAYLFIILLNLAPLALGLTIIGYALKNTLTIESAFSTIAYLNILRLPFVFFPVTVTFIGQYMVSFGRIAEFALLPEIQLPPLSPDPNGRGGMAITAGYFSWPVREQKPPSQPGQAQEEAVVTDPASTTSPDKDSSDDSNPSKMKRKIFLQDIHLDVRKGELTILIGSVGAGKTSLAMALLGEMNKESGDVFMPERPALASQEPWIINTTIRQNILFGQPYDEHWYNEVINRCSLVPDFEMLAGGDMTEVAERGANLSGGQRQRINVARALYSRREVYIFDDPFSAVDAHVGEQMFNNVILELKRQRKTVLLITNQLHFLVDADHIAFLKKGKISEQGSFDELMASNRNFAQMARTHGIVAKKDLKPLRSRDTTSAISPKQVAKRLEGDRVVAGSTRAPTASNRTGALEDEALVASNLEKGKLVTQEDMEKGAISWRVYWSYFHSSKKSLLLFISILVFSILRSAARVGGSIWVSRWVNPSTSNQYSKDVHVGAYGGILAGEILFGVCFTMTLVVFSIEASRQVQRRLLGAIIRASTRFFDSTPIGRLLARFSKDVNIVDNSLPNRVETAIDTFFQLLAVLANVATGTPYAILIVGPAIVILTVLLLLYRQTSSQLQRIEALARAPIYTHFNESIEGIATIRAFNMQENFEVANLGKVDRNMVAFLGLRRLSTWFGLLCENIAAIAVGGLVLMLVLFRNYSPKTITIGLAANALGNAVGVLTLVGAVVINVAEFEAMMNSMERILQYRRTEQEPAYEIPETEPGESWPSAGEIDFDALEMSYVPGVPVLRGIEAKVHAQEKIGIVGRTGAGKSTLITALFRTTEPSNGRILIDGVDIASLGLFDLRSRLSIIPQVPQLFLGTVRYNLDPFGSHSDDSLWQVLKRVKLRRHVRDLPGGLDAAVEENGGNFSVGQRQLISMARCLLRNTRVLLLDEATASLDPQSDALLQKMIRKYFADKTVVTIAHRLITVIDSDRIMVLDKGKVVEFDSPVNLLSNKKGILYKMVEATGEDSAAHLHKIAKGQATVSESILLHRSLAESSNIVEAP
jgi:ABC-type multidrug transport system fused ATPase/permease subunit